MARVIQIKRTTKRTTKRTKVIKRKNYAKTGKRRIKRA